MFDMTPSYVTSQSLRCCAVVHDGHRISVRFVSDAGDYLSFGITPEQLMKILADSMEIAANHFKLQDDGRNQCGG